MLAAAGRSLAKNPVCLYCGVHPWIGVGEFWKLHLPTPCSQKCRLQSFSTLAWDSIQADKTVHSFHQHRVSLMSPERSTLPATSHWATGETLTSHPCQPSSQLSSKVDMTSAFWGSRQKRLKLSHSSSLSTFISDQELYLPLYFDWVVSPFLSKDIPNTTYLTF